MSYQIYKNMKIKKQIVYKTILTDEEYRLIVDCLAYCWHRTTKHPACGLAVDEDALQKLREDLKNTQYVFRIRQRAKEC